MTRGVETERRLSANVVWVQTMKARHRVAVLSVLLVSFSSQARADKVVTTDGSQIIGIVQRLAEGKLIIETSFAGTLQIDMTRVKSIVTDAKVNVSLASGDLLVGIMSFPEGGDGQVVETALGPVSIGSVAITAVWPEGQPSPQAIAARSELEKRLEAVKPKWTTTLEAGGQFVEGNTDKLQGRGQLDVRRKTGDDLLRFYASADYSEEDDKRSRNEYKGGVYFENTLDTRWSWYTRFELEFDEFEDLDLRSTVAGGVGYYWLKDEKRELQTRFGAGYRHETYDNDDTTDDLVLDLGLDIRLELPSRMQFTHTTAYSPSFERFSDYRLFLDTALTIPLADSDAWKIKFGVKNEYNSRPQPGLHRLDSTYYANLVLQIK